MSCEIKIIYQIIYLMIFLYAMFTLSLNKFSLKDSAYLLKYKK